MILSWRAVRVVRLWAIRPDVRDMLDALDSLIPFPMAELTLELSESETIVFATFAAWFDEAERAGLITIAEEVKLLHGIGYSFHPK